MHDPSRLCPRPLDRLATLTGLVGWGLWLRVAAADLVQWYTQRKGLLCVFPDTTIYWDLAGKIRRGEPYEVRGLGRLAPLRRCGRRAIRCSWRPASSRSATRLLPVRLVQAVLGAWCVWLVARLVAAGPAGVDRPAGHALDGAADRGGARGVRPVRRGELGVRALRGALPAADARWRSGASPSSGPRGRARPALSRRGRSAGRW